jgi:hypothetical protein
MAYILLSKSLCLMWKMVTLLCSLMIPLLRWIDSPGYGKTADKHNSRSVYRSNINRLQMKMLVSENITHFLEVQIYVAMTKIYNIMSTLPKRQ